MEEPTSSSINKYPLLKKLYFWSGALLPIPSIFLYVFSPKGTIEFFNGIDSETARFWCSLTASGDAVISCLMFSSLFMKSPDVEKVTVRANWFYGLFHFGAFYYWSKFSIPHPRFYEQGYIGSIIITSLALATWGF